MKIHNVINNYLEMKQTDYNMNLDENKLLNNNFK